MKDLVERILAEKNTEAFEAFSRDVLDHLGGYEGRIVPMVETSDIGPNRIYVLIDEPTAEELTHLARMLPDTYEHNGTFEVRIASVDEMTRRFAEYLD